MTLSIIIMVLLVLLLVISIAAMLRRPGKDPGQFEYNIRNLQKL
ncbi:MAG: hypothetical protein R6V01_04045 [Thermoplasmatota archaeon]